MFKKRAGRLLLALAAIAVGAGVLLSRQSPIPHASAQAAPAPPEVVVQTLAAQNIRVWATYSGRLKAVDEARVRPEVRGRIVDVKIRDGQMVEAGDVMFVIDPRPYQAAVTRAQANLVSARAKASFAAIEFGRARNLVGTQAIARSLFDQRSNENNIAQADVQAAQASLRQAELELDHAYVKAPISGRVSRAEITLGNLVEAGPGAPLLTRIVSNDGIYADFEVDEQTYLRTIRQTADTLKKEQQIAVDLLLPGDAQQVYHGSIHTFDNQIDAGSGTIRARARFSNRDGTLVPGMFVAVKLASGTDTRALLVPDVALGSDQSKKYVYVVGPDNKVTYREVSLGAGIDGRHIVMAGLNENERVVTKGLQFLRPNMLVTPVPSDNAAATGARKPSAVVAQAKE